MDLAEFKKHVTPKIESRKLVKDVRSVIKEEKYRDQDVHEEWQEAFKPIVDATTGVKQSIDDKQNELIKQLQSGQKEIAEVIDNTAFGEEWKTAQKPITDGSEQITKLSLDKGFSDEDLAILQKHNLPKPSNVWKAAKKDISMVNKNLKRAGNVNKGLGPNHKKNRH